MALDPLVMAPKAGAGLPAAGRAAVTLLRPAKVDCLAGTMPSIPANPNANAGYLYQLAEIVTASAQVADGSIVFLGDSLTRYGDWTQVTPFAFNAGISGEGIEGVLSRAAGIACLRRAGGVVLWIGANDLNADDNQAGLKAYMTGLMTWLTGPLVVVKVAYQSGTGQKADTDDFNAHIATLAASRGSCEVVDLNPTVAPGGTIGAQYTTDGLHFSPSGYAVAYPLIRTALGRLGL